MNERKTVYKWFWVWDFEKEERWLNEMALAGWALVDVGYARFTFEACEPGEYTIRLEMHGYDAAYVEFMDQAGAQYIGRVLQWLYFRKRAEDGAFDIFSDIDSRISHIERIHTLVKALALANLFIGCLNLIINRNSGFNVGIFNLLVTSFLMYGLGRLREKKETLSRDRMLYE